MQLLLEREHSPVVPTTTHTAKLAAAKPAATPKSRAIASLYKLFGDEETKDVCVVSAVGTNLGNQNAVNIPLPKCSGKDSEWDLFRLERRDTDALHEATMGAQWTEQMKMFIFGSCMEDVAKNGLWLCIHLNHNFCTQAFLEILRKSLVRCNFTAKKRLGKSVNPTYL